MAVATYFCCEKVRRTMRTAIVSYLLNYNQINTMQENPTDSIRKLKLSKPHKIILGHLNINSLRNKFESIADVIQGTFYIFLLSGTKIDESFPDKQFC